MTTKTGEKLRGRKRDPSVLEKAWETRRRNKAKAKRAAKRSAPKLDGRTKLGRAAKALNDAQFGDKFAKPVTATQRMLQDNGKEMLATANAIGASEAEGANKAVATGPNPNYHPLDDALIAELLEFSDGLQRGMIVNAGRHVALGLTTFHAVIRRLRSTF